MGLFNNCHFLFEVELLCLSLHMEVLSFEDSVEPWTLENGVPSGESGTFPTYCKHLFKFNRGAKAAEAARNICAVYGDNAICERTARKWFSRFKEDRFDISDNPHSGRPSGFDKERFNKLGLIHNDPRQYTRELANVMYCDHSTIVRDLLSMGIFQESGVYVPHALSQNHKKISGWPYVHLCLLVIDWLVNNINHS